MFTLPLIKSHPKCYWIWHHRLWLLRQAIALLPKPIARRVWEEELGLVALMLNKDQRNFLAWGYRRHLVSTLEGPGLEAPSMAETELAYTQQKVSSGLSNFSAWHHRTKIIPRILAERGADKDARLAFLEGGEHLPFPPDHTPDPAFTDTTSQNSPSSGAPSTSAPRTSPAGTTTSTSSPT